MLENGVKTDTLPKQMIQSKPIAKSTHIKITPNELDIKTDSTTNDVLIIMTVCGTLIVYRCISIFS